MAKYDWRKIEQEYVTGDMPLRELAERYQISETTIYKHAKDGEYDEKRRKYREKVAKKALSRASTRDARAISRIMTAAERTIRKLNAAITDETVYGYIVQDQAQKDEETGEIRPAQPSVVILDKADTKALVNLSTAIRNLAMATKVMYPDGDGTGAQDEKSIVIMPDRDEEEDEE